MSTFCWNSFALADGALRIGKNRGGSEGPSVATSLRLKPCLSPKGLDTPSQETAAKTSMTVYQPPCSRTSQFLTVKVAMEQPS